MASFSFPRCRYCESHHGLRFLCDPAAKQAAEFIAHLAHYTDAAALLANPDLLARAYRIAARRAHPDAGGDTDTMARLNAARDLLVGRAR